MKKLFFFLIFVAGLLVVFNANGQNKRVALIWGNSTYDDKQWNNLPACKNDANTMDSLFKRMGFITEKLLDGNLDEMKKSVKKFATIAEGADVVVIYYSGHGVFCEHEYYLIPAKTSFGNRVDRYDLFPENELLSRLSRNRLKVFFYDACRDADETLKINSGVTKGGNPNVVRQPGNVKKDSRLHGTRWYCASKKGKKTSAGSGRLSPFTSVLSKYITYAEDFDVIWTDYIRVELNNEVECLGSYAGGVLILNPTGKKFDEPERQELASQEKNIFITTNATNAKITINGTEIEIGKEYQYKPGETYVYRIIADGYKEKTGTFEVTEKTSNNMHFNLESSEPATITIKSNTTADVKLDNKFIGRTPITYKTATGNHSITLSAEGYCSYSSRIEINQKENEKYVELSRDIPDFWDFDYNDGSISIGYSFSPKYQIGLNGLYQLEDSRFSFGAYLAFSTGFFQSIDLSGLNKITVNVGGSSTSVSTTSTSGGTAVSYQIATNRESPPKEYSPEYDPNNEASKYNSNFLFLPSAGYRLCNELMLEGGIGFATHREYIYMPCYYTKETTIITDLDSGETIGDPSTVYKRNEGDRWYKGELTWSPALRLGLRSFFSIGDFFSICLGTGYTYLPLNNEFSSWDVNLGITWFL